MIFGYGFFIFSGLKGEAISKKMTVIKKAYVAIILLTALLGLCSLRVNRAIAAEGKAQVYAIDPITTPVLKTVTLQDLDDSGFLSSPFLSLPVKSLSPYDFKAYSPQGEFLYEPVQWNYYNILAEGLTFDQASLYYYYTLARKYFEGHFGFRQALDGYHIDRLRVVLFHEATDAPVERVTAGLDPRQCIIVLGVPEDPYAYNQVHNFCANLNRTFSAPMHAYAKFVFLRYRQFLRLQNNTSQTEAITEGLAMFWPCNITDEPLYNRAPLQDAIPEKLIDLRKDVQYDINDNDPGEQGLGANRNQILSVATSLWSLREHPRIGKTNAEKIIYEAMAILPHDNPTLADLAGACSLAEKTLPPHISDNLHNYIAGVFAKHNIPRKIGAQVHSLAFLEIENTLPETMRAGEKRTVTVTFKNQTPMPQEAPSLIWFNPKMNPNVDNPDVITVYTWGIEKPLQIQKTVPAEGKVKFYLSLTAPLAPGTYACDWAIKLADGTVSCTVSKNIQITQ
jgi:hypothetical protein